MNHNFFDNIRENVNVSDIVRQKVSLTKKGQEYSGLCPFHNEKTPSFTVNDFKKFYHCFGCGAHGDVIKFLVETNGFSYMDAAKKLANENNIPIPKQSAEQKRIDKKSDEINKVLDVANDFFKNQLDKASVEYLTKRGLNENIIKEYEIGYSGKSGQIQQHLEDKGFSWPQMLEAGILAKGDDGKLYSVFRRRIMFPIKNIYGKIIAFGGRILGDGMPKYLNSPESLIFKKSEALYGENLAIGAAYKKKRIIVVEGYLDVIAMQKAGFEESVATLGTAVTKNHLTKLWKIADEIIFCLDGDIAGQKAMKKAIDLLLPALGSGIRASFLILPNKMDPDEAIRKNDATYMETLVKNRLTISEMIWHLETENRTFTNAESRADLENRLNQYIDKIDDKILVNHIKRDFNNRIWNLTKRKKNNTKNVRNNTTNNLTNIGEKSEIIEYNLCAIILRQPSILEDEEIHDNFVNLDFKNGLLANFHSIIISLNDGLSPIGKDVIKQKMQNSGFSDLFVLLSSNETPFLDILSLNDNNADFGLLWKLFMKKYELETLRKEYASAISSKEDKSFDKAKAYLEEINNVEKNIDELQNSLIT